MYDLRWSYDVWTGYRFMPIFSSSVLSSIPFDALTSNLSMWYPMKTDVDAYASRQNGVSCWTLACLATVIVCRATYEIRWPGRHGNRARRYSMRSHRFRSKCWHVAFPGPGKLNGIIWSVLRPLQDGIASDASYASVWTKNRLPEPIFTS